jgi:hypothetical protein
LTNFGFKAERFLEMRLPADENILSEDTEVEGILRYFLANFDRIGNSFSLFCYQ